MCVCACVCACVWYYLRLILGANYLLLHVQTFYKQRLKNTKAWVQCMPLLFKDLTLALQSNKNLLVNWLASPKLFRFLMQLNVKCSIFHSLTVESSQTCLFVSLFPSFLFQSVTWGLLLKQVQRGLLTFPAGVFYYWGKKCLCDSSNYVFCLGNLTFWNLLQLCI